MQSSKVRVKNKAPAQIQITAEQLLREAHDRSGGGGKRGAPARSQITDPDELREYRMNRRKEFEDAIRMNRVHLGNYVKYAKWEEEQKDFERARSVFERALDIDHRATSVWLKYAEMEMKNRFVNHARNVWDRAVTLLPRVDQFWYKYTYMEEMLENYAIARTIWERWMKWEPDDKAWSSYVKFEERRGEIVRIRQLFERFVVCHARVSTYLKYARWEERQGQVVLARQVYERIFAELADWEMGDDAAKAYLAFAAFEERQHEYERAKAVFKFAAQKYPEQARRSYADFEKKHGETAEIEAQLVAKRAAEYEKLLESRPTDYDCWLDLAHLHEERNDEARQEATREIYERAVARVPPIQEKRYWRRYIYIWLNYAVYEELVAKDFERARAVYAAARSVVPHRLFTFAKLWLMAADFEVRRKALGAARKLLGEAIGRCPKPKIFKGYLSLERRLGEVDRCRRIHAKYVEFAPSDAKAWIGFADFEAAVGETVRARAIFDLAVDQPDLDYPETVWKAYLDLEIKVERGEIEDDEDSNGAGTRAIALYERLLERTKHVRVWTSYAKYHSDRPNVDAKLAASLARAVFDRAYDHFKHDHDGAKDERVVLLDSWAELEASFNDKFDNMEQLDKVRALMPRKVKKRRQVQPEGHWEEYYDYVFPDDKKAPLNLKILEMARKWKEGVTK